jgi:hypothetical protein
MVYPTRVGWVQFLDPVDELHPPPSGSRPRWGWTRPRRTGTAHDPRHNGFSTHRGDRIARDDPEGREALCQYILRKFFSVEKRPHDEPEERRPDYVTLLDVSEYDPPRLTLKTWRQRTGKVGTESVGLLNGRFLKRPCPLLPGLVHGRRNGVPDRRTVGGIWSFKNPKSAFGRVQRGRAETVDL